MADIGLLSSGGVSGLGRRGRKDEAVQPEKPELPVAA
jgi:hypothetical protein